MKMKGMKMGAWRVTKAMIAVSCSISPRFMSVQYDTP